MGIRNFICKSVATATPAWCNVFATSSYNKELVCWNMALR
jgi:hypothetical protein